MIEGADNNEPQNNLIGYNPAPDAIAELRVVAANANATYGNANGGAVVTILKSGTNQFSRLGCTTYSRARSSIPIPGATITITRHSQEFLYPADLWRHHSVARF